MSIEVIEKKNIRKGSSEKYINLPKYGETYFVPVIDGKKSSCVAETWEMAMLIGIGIKLDRRDSQFPCYAARMLKIDSRWAE